MSEVGPALESLAAALSPLLAARQETLEARRRRIVERTQETRDAARASALAGRTAPMSKAWVGHCITQATKGEKTTVLHELGCPLSSMDLKGHGDWYFEPLSGGLGWGLPTAMGIKLAEPDRLVIATIGDGSHTFANPVACHQMMERYGLAVLTIVLNNQAWGTVGQSVRALYPEGRAAQGQRDAPGRPRPQSGLRPCRRGQPGLCRDGARRGRLARRARSRA